MKMKIAILGIRGIPAKYGGFETFAEQLSIRLVEKSHQVTVYGRSNIIKNYQTGSYYKGVKLVILPTISYKYLDTITHTFLSIIHSLFQFYDIILICNAANTIFSFIPRLFGCKVVINVDGIERRRKKWSLIGKLWYLISEMLCCVFPNEIVTDNSAIEKYYLRRYNKKSTVIPYGYNSEKILTTNILDRIGLNPREYILFVARLEPENNAHLVITAFRNVQTNKKLVIVGDAPYAKRYIDQLKKLAQDDNRIVFTGFVFGQGFKELQSNAYCYIHAGEVCGTSPALVEAMGYGNCIIVNGTAENKEVIGDSGIVYKMNDVEDLSMNLKKILQCNQDLLNQYRDNAKKRAIQYYSWETVTDKYESLFLQMLKK
ncbi:MAG: glycosyltransferase [Elusimicrobiota bacterium]